MSKSKRLMELMMVVNQKRKFTVKELSDEFGVSKRTILRDLQELGELGVPLYSEVGPHGGYGLLKERILPPIAFTEEEAVAIFFSIHALRHYSSLPFKSESISALRKFYHYLPQDMRIRIDQMKARVDFVTPTRNAQSPYLPILLDAAVRQKVLLIDYESGVKRSSREIQPIGIYTRSGLWYCRAYSYQGEDIRVFRCDRISSVTHSERQPMDLGDNHLENRGSNSQTESPSVPIFAELTKNGVEACEADPGSVPMLHIREDGTGWLKGHIPKHDMLYFAKFLIHLGKEVILKDSAEILNCMKKQLTDLMVHYGD
ncbi:helix-turn-helix transcriptional regulator [Paenibacillus sp. KN14-4R]|uniref:helix-turn-helix transcriptional regulator n=1 Tax=Paenibacillus sp. KN14-4R TaxID=3445773 RepID=UPI003F9F921A